MNRFLKLNPSALFLYFILSIGFVLVLNNPFFSIASLVCGLLYSAFIDKKKALDMVWLSAVAIAIVSAFNMLFVHFGDTILFEIRQISFTLEALAFGANQGFIMAFVFVWFYCLSKTLDSEKTVYILRFAPKLALMLSMILGFIPRFSRKLGEIRDARLALRGGAEPQTKKEKLKEGIEVFSALITYSLEGSIITADSMQGRGYNPKAIYGKRYKTSVLDVAFVMITLLLSVGVGVLCVVNKTAVTFQPTIEVNGFSAFALVLFVVLELMPTIICLKEEILWKLSQLKA